VRSSFIFLGVKGRVIALDRATGQQLWNTELKAGDFVNLVVDEELVIAATRGEVFGLDANSGKILWRNGLPGMGFGLISVATANGVSSGLTALEKKRRDDAAAAAASSA
jgi:outer membrane protein assembly factor BamB